MKLFDMPLEELRNYRPESTKEADFELFWSELKKDSFAQPLNIQMEKIDYPTNKVVVYDVSFDGYKNSRIHGKYVIPSGIGENEKIPGIVMYHGYNWNNIRVSSVLGYTALGIAVLYVDTRGQNLKSPDHNGYGNGGVSGWMTLGILDNHNYYYKYVFMDCVRAIEVIKTMNEVDGKKIITEGGSQGGALAFAAGAIHGGVRAIMADIPFLCHYRRAVELSTEGPYNEIASFFKVYDQRHSQEELIYKNLSYFDNVNLAELINCDTLISAGLEDNVCPPSTVFAMYNNITAPKKIVVYPDFGHGGFSEHGEEKIEFLNSII